MNIPDWLTSSGGGDAWDVLVLDGQPLPGVAQVSIDCPPGLDIQKPKGGRAARIVDNGLPPVMLHCKLTLKNVAMVNALAPFMPILRPKAKGAATRKVRVTHPQALIWGFSDVQILDLKVPPVKPGGAYVIEFNMTEWAPEATKVKEKKPANGQGTGGPTARELADGLKADGKKNRTDNT